MPRRCKATVPTSAPRRRGREDRTRQSGRVPPPGPRRRGARARHLLRAGRRPGAMDGSGRSGGPARTGKPRSPGPPRPPPGSYRPVRGSRPERGRMMSPCCPPDGGVRVRRAGSRSAGVRRSARKSGSRPGSRAGTAGKVLLRARPSPPSLVAPDVYTSLPYGPPSRQPGGGCSRPRAAGGRGVSEVRWAPCTGVPGSPRISASRYKRFGIWDKLAPSRRERCGHQSRRLCALARGTPTPPPPVLRAESSWEEVRGER